MKFAKLAAAMVAVSLPGAAIAQDAAIAARQGIMQVQAHSLSILGGMARGLVEYDAELAAAAAANAAALGGIDHSILWPAGTDNASVENTRALPAIWGDMDAFMSIWDDYAVAASALAETAGDGLDALRAGIGPVGQTCGTCHETYRQPR